MDIGHGVIDPALLEASEATNGAITAHAPLLITLPASKSSADWDASNLPPRRDELQGEYTSRLDKQSRKAPLAEACMQLGIKVPKTATLTRLREELVKHWFQSAAAAAAPPRRRANATGVPGPSRRPATDAHDVLASVLAPNGRTLVVPRPAGNSPPHVPGGSRGEFRGAVPLASDLNRPHTSNYVQHAAPFGVDRTRSPHCYRSPSRTHHATPRAGTSRHADTASDSDDDDDEASLIKTYGVDGANSDELLGYDSSEDPEEIEGDEEAPTDDDDDAAHTAFKNGVRVETIRRAEGIGVPAGSKLKTLWSKLGSAEREKKSRRGQPIPGTRLGASQLKKLFFGALRIRKQQDAANPTLAQSRPATTFITWEGIKCRMDESIHRVRDGHEENEDAPDIRANTFLPEVTDQQLQIIGYGFLAHRQKRLVIFGHLAWTCQHATGNRGDDFRALKLAELQPYTIIHPNRTTAIQSVLGLQGEEKAGKRGMRTITDTLKIDWSVNKSWRQIRILHGPKSPNTPYNEQNLYNLYCKAYAFAGFSSKMKAHLPRHLLGYRQEALGVDGADTAKLGWVRGQTYFDTYAPALPKKAILGAAGYQAEETYDPVWRHVHVPEQFLRLICPNAEEIHESIANKANLSGAANYWLMVMDLRPYAFQASPHLYPTQLKIANASSVRAILLQAKAGNPIDLVNIQNAILQKASRTWPSRRTPMAAPTTPPIVVHLDQNMEQTGTYHMEDDMSDSIRAFVNSSPKSSDVLRAATQVDLVLPPTDAFYKAGKIFLWLHGLSSRFSRRSERPVSAAIGQKSARWPDVFPLIQQPKMCWAVWGPTKTVNQFVDVNELWKTYVDGEAVYTEAGVQTGMKPPSNLSSNTSKPMAHPRRCQDGGDAGAEDGGARKGMNWLRIEIETKRKQAVLAVRSAASASSPASSSTPTAATSLATSIDEAPDVYPPTLGPAFSLQAAPNTTEKAAKRKQLKLDIASPIEKLPACRSLCEIYFETGEFLGFSFAFFIDMGVPAFWDFIKPAAKTRTLLNLATTEGFEPNKRGLRTLLVGIDIRQGPAISASEFIQINACIQIHSGNQAAALKTLFYQLCNLQEAPVTPIFVFDGPGRPVFKRGVAVSHNQPWLIGPLKDLLTAFRYYFYEEMQAPGEAEAELADLNKLGFVDVVITEDSDAVIFGAPCVFRKSGPHVTDMSQIYTADSLASHPFYLDEDGLLLLVLLLGGDYHRGLSGDKRDEELLKWRNALKDELKTNSAGLLEKRQPKLANNIPPDFPDLDVVELYTDPLTSWSSRFAGTPPDTSCWTPCEPIVNQISDFCVARFGWQEVILDRFKSNLWPGVALRMIFSRYLIYDKRMKRFATPNTNATLLKILNQPSGSMAPMGLVRIRISIANFIQKAGFQPGGGIDYILVTIPRSIFAIATRDLSLPATNLFDIVANDEPDDSDSQSSSHSDSDKENKAAADGDDDGDDDMIDLMQIEETELVDAHHRLSAGGVIDLTG
ncbi:hypothetical protein B0H10DRAFT_1958552 [Mycena sp. CBHHK59/15]|nr:hypothetical protein B0H10DRAFT_1958552 [Mycena sp. CBHHK59/15]